MVDGGGCGGGLVVLCTEILIILTENLSIFYSKFIIGIDLMMLDRIDVWFCAKIKHKMDCIGGAE